MCIVYLNFLDDPFKKHFADLDEISLARQVSDIQNDKLLAKFSKDSFWSSSYKYPASSKEAPSASARIPQSTRDLRVRSSLSILCVYSLQPSSNKSSNNPPQEFCRF